MSSWVLLLLLAALSAARLRPSSTEGDPLPTSLVDLVRDSPIASVDDLKLLLQQHTNAIEEEEDEHDNLTSHTHGRYTRSLMDAQPAVQAACKTRTEVMEVTRSMLDRRNANFIPWPPCVEVQRCSGCCNSRVLQCVPTVTSSRYLKVIKIKYAKGKPTYEPAIISVDDHVTCRCTPPSSSTSPSSPVPIPRSPTQSNPNPATPHQPPPPSSSHLHKPVQPAAAPPKTHASKADLHRHDDLKYNQQQHYHQQKQQHTPEEREGPGGARQWQQGSYTQLVHWTQPRVHQQQPPHPQQQQPVSRGLGPLHGWPSEARAEHSVSVGTTVQQVGHGSGYDGSREEGGVHVATSTTAAERGAHHPDHIQRQQQLLEHQQRQQQYQQQYQYRHQSHYPPLRTQYRLNGPQSDSGAPPTPGGTTQPPESDQNKPTPPLLTTTTTANHKDSAVTSQKYDRPTEVTNHRQTEPAATEAGQNGREESGSANSGDAAVGGAEVGGAEVANQGKARDSNLTTSGEGLLTEEDKRRAIVETVQRELERETHLHPHHPQQRPKPTPMKTVPSTVPPKSPAARQAAPFRPASPRRRRKHRKRMSKDAIRAMIMKW